MATTKRRPTQKTPTGHKIPVPTKGEVFTVLERAAKPLPLRRSRPKEK